MLSGIFTVQGMSGFVSSAILIKDEGARAVTAALEELVPLGERRESVEYVAVDWATKELHVSMCKCFPRLRGVCEDPVYLV